MSRRIGAAFAAGRVVPAILTLAATPVLARALGADGFGDLSLALAVSAATTAGIFGWCEPLVVRELSTGKPRFSKEMVASLSLLLGTGVLAVVWLVALATSDWVVAAVGTASVAIGLTTYFSGIARAEGRPGLFVLVAILAVGGRSLGGLFAVLIGFGVAGYMWAWSCLCVVAVVVGVRGVGLRIRDVRAARPSRDLVAYAFPIAGVALATLLLQVGDRLGLKLFVTSEQLGLYALGYSLTEIGVTLIFQVLHVRRFPLLLGLWSSSRPAGYAALQVNVYLATAVSLALVPLMLAGGDDLARLAGGPTFGDMPVEFMALVAAGLACNGASQWAAVDLQFTRRTGIWFRATAVGVAVNLVVVLATATWFGIVAGGVATLAAYFSSLVLMLYWTDDSMLTSATARGAALPVVACALSTTSVVVLSGAGSIVAGGTGACVYIAVVGLGFLRPWRQRSRR